MLCGRPFQGRSIVCSWTNQGQSLATGRIIRTCFFLKFAKSWNNLNFFHIGNEWKTIMIINNLFGHHDALKIYQAPKCLINLYCYVLKLLYQSYFLSKTSKIVKSWNNLNSFLLHIGKNRYIFGYHDPLKIYGAPKSCTVMYWNYCF